MKNPYSHIGAEPPYYDDFNAEKNYMRIMYNPGRAVQARELTQCQTSLQNQIASAGAFFYKDGTPISGGRITMSLVQPFMKVALTDTDGQPIDVRLLVGKTFTGNSSGQKINVTDCDTEKRYIFFSYLGGALVEGESFISTTTPTKTFYMEAGSVDTAIIAHCDSGTLFINGFYITIPSGDIVVAADDQDALYNIGYKIEEQFVTSATDPSLNDNATGSTNANAPGADRYQLTASLYSFKGSEAPDGIKFIAGIAIQNKVVIKEQDDPLKDSALMDLLAKRTYDESGSYTVKPWKIQLKEHKTDSSKYIVSVQEGSGYIQGYNVETRISTDIEANKSRSSLTKDDINVFNNDGLYTYALYENNILSATAIPQFNTEVVEVTTGKNGTGTVIGECYIRSLYKESNRMLIYLYNAAGVSNGFNGARSIRSKQTPANYINLYVDENNFAVLLGEENPSIINLGYSYVKSLTATGIEYESIKRYTVTSEAANNTINVIDSNANVDFLTTESLIAIYNNEGQQIDITALSVIPNNSSSVSSATIQGSSIVNGTEYTVILRIRIEEMSSKTKVLQTNTETITVQPSDSGIVKLAKEDIFDIISVTQTTNTNDKTPANLVSYVGFDNGQTDYLYDKGAITGLNSAVLKTFMNTTTANTTYSVTYRYFEHSGVGPFTVNSYISEGNKGAVGEDVDLYSKIPTFTSSSGRTYKLADCLDFRVKKSDATNTQLNPLGKTELRVKADIYLPRWDSVYVTKSGDFGILEGIPSETPVVPTPKEGSMTLYNIYNAAYGTNLDSITLSYVDNRRYTMRDIAKLDTRLMNVEDAVSISQLEMSAMNMQILDSDGLNKYKTGIFTDNFASFDNSDYTNSEWDCTIDSVEQSLRPNFNAENYSFVYSDTESIGVKKSGTLVHLPYTTKVYAKNELASDTVNVQKLMFYVWNGALKLVPGVDTWVNDLGQFVVDTTYTETPKPPTTFRTWSTSSSSTSSNTRYTGRAGRDQYSYTTTTTTTTTTNYTATTSWNGSWVLSQSFNDMERQDEFMRQRSVAYSLSGMRQGMKVKGFMDNVELVLSNDTVDNDGNLSGTFTVPENMPVGTKTVYFYDVQNTSNATSYYTANGKTIWTDVTNNYIRNWTPVTTTTSTTSTSSSSNTVSRYLDPVAQSFLVSEPQGIYLDSVDIYFKTKDAKEPVFLYIVEVENGYPTNRMVPFSHVTKKSSEVVLSDDATAATKFSFDCPIYLQGNTEYAFVVATNSYEYSIFISTLGQADLHSGIGIYEQPFLGSMFLSQNATTWTAEQQSDITFAMNCCVFDTNSTGTAIFNLQQPETAMEVAIQTLVANDFILDGTEVIYEYKWDTDSLFKQFNNREDIFLTELKNILASDDANVPSLQIRMKMKTSNAFISPVIDTEQVYGIFCNNIVKTNDDQVYPYTAGTYISKATTLKYASEDIRIMLDAILPNNSEVDAYIKTNTYNPIYVVQSSKGTLGVDTAAADALTGKVLQLYYHNTSDKRLEPKSSVEMAGYKLDGRKIYLRAVGNPDEFKSVASASDTESQYVGLDTKYKDLILLPVYSESNISIDIWNKSTSYTPGQYVIYNGSIWVALRIIEQNQIPSTNGISWQKVECLKTISTVKTDNEVTWRPMKKVQSTNNSTLERQSKFIEYTYYPELVMESEFQTFSVKLVLKSKDKVNVPRVRNLRVIATV